MARIEHFYIQWKLSVSYCLKKDNLKQMSMTRHSQTDE